MAADPDGKEFAVNLTLLTIIVFGVVQVLQRITQKNGSRIVILPDQGEPHSITREFLLKVLFDTRLLERIEISGVEINTHDQLDKRRKQPS
ncbi:MAG TPA: hypothetical protein VF258_02985 [Luteolibacter sp.]